MAAGSVWRAAAVSAQVAALIVALGCESPTAPAPGGAGAIGGTVTINGEARPIVWVELRHARDGFRWPFQTTIPSGSWEWGQVPAEDYVVAIKTPPGLTCDATSKSATVESNRRTVVNFACVGDVNDSIWGLASNEFGPVASARVTVNGPVNRETISNQDGFFAFGDLPPGEYLMGWHWSDPGAVATCYPVRVSVRDGAPAFATVDCS